MERGERGRGKEREREREEESEFLQDVLRKSFIQLSCAGKLVLSQLSGM